MSYNCKTMRLKETKCSWLQKMQKIRKKWLDVREGRCYLVRLFGGPPLSIRNGGSTRKPSHTTAKKSTSRLFMQFCLGTPNSATFYQKSFFFLKYTIFALEEVQYVSNMHETISQLCNLHYKTDQQIEIASSAFSNFSCSTNSASISPLGDETINIFSLYFFILLRQSRSEGIYNPIKAKGFSAMFIFQLDNTKR